VGQNTRPSAVVRSGDEVREQTVEASSSAELLTECLARWDRARATTLDSAVARELSIAITHVEDAITRSNKAGYRMLNRFAITDAERWT